MPTADREAILVETDLRALATDICGPPRGHGRSARWHCPDPGHPDNNPSMGIYRSTGGWDRWKCHSCGQGGTAVDLLVLSGNLSVGEALRDLARDLGHLPADPSTRTVRRPRPAVEQPQVQDAPTQPDPALGRLVDQAADLLWKPVGSGARTYLCRRGFTNDVLRANRVGFDPGPRHLPRLRGLPYRGPGIVFPALDPVGVAVYYQLRYLDTARAGRKYDQPTAALAPNPRIAEIVVTGSAPPGYLVVCEGFPDALTAVQAGLRSVAVLGITHAGDTATAPLAQALIDRYPATRFAVCFDADNRTGRPGKPDTGRLAGTRLVAQIAQAGVPVAHIVPAAPHKDLNDWWRSDPEALARVLTDTDALVGVAVRPEAPKASAATAALPAIGD